VVAGVAPEGVVGDAGTVGEVRPEVGVVVPAVDDDFGAAGVGVPDFGTVEFLGSLLLFSESADSLEKSTTTLNWLRSGRWHSDA